MTGKRCTDCKHTKGIGYDFWCGEGHTEYEVLGAETNCPYYEYYDWSKGVPSMTEKRFRISKVFELNRPFPIYDGDCPLTQQEAMDLLNELSDENKRLRRCINEIYTIARLEEV